MTTFMYGVLPGRGLDLDAMRNTLHRVAHTDAPQNSVHLGNRDGCDVRRAPQ